MKPLLNTLYITIQNAWLSREGEQVVVKVEREVRLRVPIHTLCSIVCFGAVTVTPFLMELASEKGVCISFMRENGRFMARVEGPVRGNVLLRREQYRRSDDPAACLEIVRAIVVGKLANCRTVLQRGIRDHGDTVCADRLKVAVDGLARISGRLARAENVDEARGREGEAADLYFRAFDDLIVSQKESFRFTRRSRRPPLDPINTLLSFVYTLLTHDVRSALETVGLDPAVGFLHRDRPGRPSLALDIMEEFRPLLADRLVLTLVNRLQVKPNGFRTTESGACLMEDDTRKEVLIAWQKRKQEEILHPWLDEKIPIGTIPYIQAQLLARHLRGDYDAYPPFAWK